MAFLSDALGSTLALTDSSGAINTSYTYEPFGKSTVAGTNANPCQFTGRENDAAAPGSARRFDSEFGLAMNGMEGRGVGRGGRI